MIDFLTAYWVLFAVLAIGCFVVAIYEMYQGAKKLIHWIVNDRKEWSDPSKRFPPKTAFIPRSAVMALFAGICGALAVVGIFAS